MRYGQVWHVTARCLVTAGHDGELARIFHISFVYL